MRVALLVQSTVADSGDRGPHEMRSLSANDSAECAWKLRVAARRNESCDRQTRRGRAFPTVECSGVTRPERLLRDHRLRAESERCEVVGTTVAGVAFWQLMLRRFV